MSKLLGPNVGYIDLLNAKTDMVVEAEEEGGRKYTPLRPSASGKCTRELYYELREYHGLSKYDKELRTASVHRLLGLGHNIEYHLLKQFELLKDVFSQRYKQQVLSFTYLKAENHPEMSQWLEGSLDTVFWSDKYKCVADVKSKNDRWDFRARKMKWDATSEKLRQTKSVEAISDDAFWVEDLAAFLADLDDPFFAANFLQLNLYANAEFLVERGVDHAAIIQYNKNDSRLREIRFKPSRAVYESTLEKFGNALKAVDTDTETLATRDWEEGSFKCRYCPFQSECWGKKGKKK